MTNLIGRFTQLTLFPEDRGLTDEEKLQLEGFYACPSCDYDNIPTSITKFEFEVEEAKKIGQGSLEIPRRSRTLNLVCQECGCQYSVTIKEGK